MLVHYDSAKPIKLAYDTSCYGTGAVLSHVCDNGVHLHLAHQQISFCKTNGNVHPIVLFIFKCGSSTSNEGSHAEDGDSDRIKRQTC